MRLACGLAIVLWLSFSAGGMASCQQDPSGSASSAGQTLPSPASAEPAPAAGTPAPVIVPKEKTKAKKRRKSTASAPSGGPRKIVVREGGAKEPAAQIVPGMTPAEAVRERNNAERSLGSADLQLKFLAGRTLDTRQQETMGQIRNYMEGARSALKEGDVRRASTLAEKARLLAENLVRH